MYIPSQPQFIKRDALDSLAVILAWLFGVVAPILISTFGNYVAFIGGWDNLSRVITTNALIIAAVWQAICFACQFSFKSRRWWIAYGVALVVSVAPTFVGYYTPIYDYLEPMLKDRLDNAVTPVIMLFTVIGAFLLDALPEWIAVRD